LKEMASSGQSSMQLKQTKHSLLRSWVCGSEAPSQLLRQRVAVDAPESDGGKGAEKSAERTEDAAEKPGNEDVHSDEEKEQEPDDPGADMKILADIDGAGHEEIEGRQDDRAHRAVKEADGVEPADLEGAANRGGDHGDQDDVFKGIQFFVAVGLDAFAFISAAFAKEPAGEMMEDAIGADPIAENAAEEERG